MKPFNTLTEDELLNLTETDVQNYIEYLCAERGIKILPPAPVNPDNAHISKDITIYTVAGVHFTNNEEAAQVANYIMNCKTRCKTEYKSLTSGYTYVVEPCGVDDDLSITTEQYFSLSKFHEIQKELTLLNEAKALYTQQEKEYKEIYKARAEVSTEVLDTIQKVYKKERTFKGFCEILEKYVLLADGDYTIAFKFLTTNYAVDSDLLVKIKEKYNYVEPF